MHVRDCSCTPILLFFSAASDGATANHQILNRILVNFFKDSIANYASIWTVFSPTVKRTRCALLYNSLNVSFSLYR